MSFWGEWREPVFLDIRFWGFWGQKCWLSWELWQISWELQPPTSSSFNFFLNLQFWIPVRISEGFWKLLPSLGPSRLSFKKLVLKFGVVVARLAQRSLPTPEVRGSTPAIGIFYIEHLFTLNCIKKTKRSNKMPEIGHFKKMLILLVTSVLHI